MARRRRVNRRRVYARPKRARRARAASYYFRAKRRRSGGKKSMFGLSGKTRPIINGMAAGAIGQIATNYIGNWGHPASALGVGIIRNDQVLITEGSRGIGAMVASMFFGGTSGGASQV